jgi:hypothetical protein
MMSILLQFLVGVFATNSIPHIVNGLSGRRFRTPFVPINGTKLSSPVVNVLWGAANVAIAWWLNTISPLATPLYAAVGAIVTGVALAILFTRDNR